MLSLKGFSLLVVVLALGAALVGLGAVNGNGKGQGPPDAIPGQYIVVLVGGASPEQVAADHGLGRLHTYRAALNGFAAAIPDERLDGVRNDSRVNSVVADRLVSIPEPEGKAGAGGPGGATEQTPTGVNRIDAESAVGTFPSIAILDTGIDLSHPDLNVAGAVSFTSGNGNDQNGHGTHVAGTASARAGNGIGVRGVAPGAPLYAVQVLNAAGMGSWSSVIAGVDWVTANSVALNIKVANMSLGGSGSDTGNCGVSVNGTVNDPLHKAICNSVAAGVTYVVAAGNSSKDASTFVPAAYDEVVTVSAIADYNGKGGGGASPTCASYGPDDGFATFSNYGADVDLAAPGVCITSTWKGGGYKTISGTSMASPHVAGAAAIKVAAGATTPAAVKTALLASAQPAASTATGCAYTGTKSGEPLVYVGQPNASCQ
ncbi:MAG: S8 family serine peptidase [Chloroflexi bacterium]|nr:S8 family serine peptidase [Chloroflexota bacterium]